MSPSKQLPLLAIHNSRFCHCWNVAWNAFSMMASSSRIAHSLNFLYGLETISFQSCFNFWKQEKSLLGLSPENKVGGAQQMSGVLPDSCE